MINNYETKKCNKTSIKPVLVAVVHGISWDGAKLLPITAQNLRTEDVLVATTVTQ